VNGSTHLGDAQAVQAQSDLSTAYAAAAARTPSGTFAGDQNGATFDSGVFYSVAAMSLTGTMTLDAENNPSAVFIFQVNAAVATAASSTVKLINGAQASNVFWQVNGAFTTGAGSSFSGTVLANGAITLGAGASLDGGALAVGLVTLGDNVVTAPDALTFTSPPTPTKASTVTTTDSVLATGASDDTGAITYSSTTPSICTVATGGALTYLTAGTCTIEATQAADAAAGLPVRTNSQSITVTFPVAPLSLGSAVNYAVLGGTGVTSTGDTVANGDLGVGPAAAVVGVPPGVVNGSPPLGDAQAV
jgi:hypothetical protein